REQAAARARGAGPGRTRAPLRLPRPLPAQAPGAPRQFRAVQQGRPARDPRRPDQQLHARPLPGRRPPPSSRPDPLRHLRPGGAPQAGLTAHAPRGGLIVHSLTSGRVSRKPTSITSLAPSVPASPRIARDVGPGLSAIEEVESPLERPESHELVAFE